MEASKDGQIEHLTGSPTSSDSDEDVVVDDGGVDENQTCDWDEYDLETLDILTTFDAANQGHKRVQAEQEQINCEVFGRDGIRPSVDEVIEQIVPKFTGKRAFSGLARVARPEGASALRKGGADRGQMAERRRQELLEDATTPVDMNQLASEITMFNFVRKKNPPNKAPNTSNSQIAEMPPVQQKTRHGKTKFRPLL